MLANSNLSWIINKNLALNFLFLTYSNDKLQQEVSPQGKSAQICGLSSVLHAFFGESPCLAEKCKAGNRSDMQQRLRSRFPWSRCWLTVGMQSKISHNWVCEVKISKNLFQFIFLQLNNKMITSSIHLFIFLDMRNFWKATVPYCKRIGQSQLHYKIKRIIMALTDTFFKKFNDTHSNISDSVMWI